MIGINTPTHTRLPTNSFEHEDAITGFVAEWGGQPFNRAGWGGLPLDMTVTVEKDKSSTCVQVGRGGTWGLGTGVSTHRGCWSKGAWLCHAINKTVPGTPNLTNCRHVRLQTHANPTGRGAREPGAQHPALWLPPHHAGARAASDQTCCCCLLLHGALPPPSLPRPLPACGACWHLPGCV